jgi:hypothetical protein
VGSRCEEFNWGGKMQSKDEQFDTVIAIRGVIFPQAAEKSRIDW